jgi:hypothetical protein
LKGSQSDFATDEKSLVSEFKKIPYNFEASVVEVAAVAILCECFVSNCVWVADGTGAGDSLEHESNQNIFEFSTTAGSNQIRSLRSHSSSTISAAMMADRFAARAPLHALLESESSPRPAQITPADNAKYFRWKRRPTVASPIFR